VTPAERTLRGRIGAYSLHAQGATNTGPARAAFLSKFEVEVDPEGILPEAERRRRAIAARKAHFSKLALKSAQIRGRAKRQVAIQTRDPVAQALAVKSALKKESRRGEPAAGCPTTSPVQGDCDAKQL
jgi:hypothetical protein